MAKRILTRCLLIMALVAIPSIVSAEMGDGIKSGAFTLTPGISLAGNYTNNLFYESADETNPSAAPSMSVRPFFKIETEEANNLQLSLDSSLTYQQYFSESGAISEQSGLSADVGIGAAFNTQGAFSFKLEDRFVRTNEPPSNPTSFAYNRVMNRLGATAGLHPGGKALQHYLSYNWILYRHDRLTDLNRMIHNFNLNNYWLFLPRTSFVLSADFSLVDYENQLRDGGGTIANPTFVNSNSSPLRITGGVTGLITERIGLRLTGGYGWSFHDQGDTYQGLLLDIQAQWYFGGSANKNKLYLGYSRDFGDATISNFYARDRPYAGYSQSLLSDRLNLNAEVSTSFRAYGGVPAGAVAGSAGSVNIPPNLADVLLRVSLGADYNLTKWWSAGIAYDFSANFTDDVVVTATGTDSLRDFQRHVVSVNTTVRY